MTGNEKIMSTRPKAGKMNAINIYYVPPPHPTFSSHCARYWGHRDESDAVPDLKELTV